MQLKKRIDKLETKYLASKEPSSMAIFWWGLHRKFHPELTDLPERPPDDWIEYYHGKCFEDVLRDCKEFEAHGDN